jgi:hypothetical protein
MTINKDDIALGEAVDLALQYGAEEIEVYIQEEDAPAEKVTWFEYSFEAHGLAALLAHVSQEAKPKWQKIETAPKETTK